MTESYPAVSPETAPAPEKKRRRIFLWFFLAVQVLFILWIVTGIANTASSPNDCGPSLDQQTCNDASDAGTAIGVFLIVLFWCFVDFILGVGYFIYRLARRP